MFEFQGCLKSSMLLPLKSSPSVIVAVSSKSVSICNRFQAKLVNSSRNRAF